MYTCFNEFVLKMDTNNSSYTFIDSHNSDDGNAFYSINISGNKDKECEIDCVVIL